MGNSCEYIEGNPTNPTIVRIKDQYDTYTIAFIGASQKEDGRIISQMQKGTKPKVISAYENSKKNNEKFFIIVPDSTTFALDDYYVFVELFEKGDGVSSTFEIHKPATSFSDRVCRDAIKAARERIKYIVTYVPAKDSAGAESTDMLRNYLLCFDSRPFSKYIVNYCDFLPVPEEASKIVEHINNDIWPNNFLIAGAPGTGKSHLVDTKVDDAIRRNIYFSMEDAEDKYDAEKVDLFLQGKADELSITVSDYFEGIKRERVRRVTFYEEYSYESFVGCYKPIKADVKQLHDLKLKLPDKEEAVAISGGTQGSSVTYGYEVGPFIKTYIDAKNNPESLYFIVIEEINRAKAASVFGDMFQLLDRKSGVSEYAITPESALDLFLCDKIKDYDGTIRLPQNMYIWATMNNADQGVFPLDSAFKRRWGYMYLDVNSSRKDGDIFVGKQTSVRWNIFREFLNEKIIDFATEDKCIGAWYFKDEELEQIKKYYNSEMDSRNGLLNPLADKLLIYLLNDVCRLDPSLLFKENYRNMPAIRKALINGIELRDILDLEWNRIFELNSEWITRRKATDSHDSQDIVTGEETMVDENISDVTDGQ